MPLNDRIFKLRTAVKMTREQFAEEFGVSRQTILKWENGTSYPELSKLIDISRRFDISLDSLILDRNMRMIEELKGNYGKKTISPNYSNIPNSRRNYPIRDEKRLKQAIFSKKT